MCGSDQTFDFSIPTMTPTSTFGCGAMNVTVAHSHAHGFSESESIDLSNDQVFSAIDLYMDQMFSQVITSSYPLPISSSSSEASMPVLHADCISDNGGLWRYEDPFASDVMPMM